MKVKGNIHLLLALAITNIPLSMSNDSVVEGNKPQTLLRGGFRDLQVDTTASGTGATTDTTATDSEPEEETDEAGPDTTTDSEPEEETDEADPDIEVDSSNSNSTSTDDELDGEDEDVPDGEVPEGPPPPGPAQVPEPNPYKPFLHVDNLRYAATNLIRPSRVWQSRIDRQNELNANPSTIAAF
ncbi:unnamed protein product [Pseudo-nitzschia multistriata]|uniref:RxLR effector protein n=1 Tax=Pseudo-nitzschia multistriata TaxID=183589 RepID=A0A448YWD2_9STRA|nr:unnamed protein product [Pseudo-nitzschia multistriata]